MSFRSAYGNTISENGWRMCNRDECVIVEGPYMNTAPLRKGVPATILGDFVRRYHTQCAPVVSSVWGWSNTNDVPSSNHLSGTAVDINAPQWPWGVKKMPAHLVDRINALLGFYEGAVFWGRVWGKPDEMHFQMGWPEGDPRYDRIVAKLGGAPVTSVYYAQPGDINNRVKHLQEFLNGAFPSYSKLALSRTFDAATAAVVKEFQSRVDVDADGIVGPVTVTKLKEFGFEEVPVDFTPEPTPGKKRFPQDWSDRDLLIEILRQLRGPTLDGWEQLGGKTVVDKLGTL